MHTQTEFDRINGISPIIEILGGFNTTQIFVHSVNSLENIAEIAMIASGLEKYPERSLVFARRDDIVCVAEAVDKRYIQFLRSLGIGPRNGNIVVVSENVHPNSSTNLSDLLMGNYEALLKIRNLTKRNKKIILNPFIATYREFKLSKILEEVLGRRVHLIGGNSDLVDYVNHKHNVRAKALELGVPVPEGDIIELRLGRDGRPLDLTPIEAAFNRYIHKTGRVVVKGSYGASGSSLFIVENNPESIKKTLSNISGRIDNRIYIVEVMVDVIVSPNILMHIELGNGRILCVGITDQLLSDKLVHEGNIYPPSAKTINDMVNSAQRISKWLQTEGYRGLVGFDFGEYVHPKTGEFNHFLAEINPRTNAATYSKSLMDHLNRKQKGGPYIEAFLSANVKTKAGSFSELNELYGHLFFNTKTGKGLVPYNTGCLEYDKFTLAVFGKSRNEVIDMYEDFKSLLEKE
ncbi:MAG: hypothetical protein C4291_01505 [Candidatus Dadabacteria bacterium]